MTEEKALLEYVKSIAEDLRAHRRESAEQHGELIERVGSISDTANENKNDIKWHRRHIRVMALIVLGIVIYLSTKDPQALAEIVRVGR